MLGTSIFSACVHACMRVGGYVQTYVYLYMEVRDQGGSSPQLLSILDFERGSSIESGAHLFSKISWLTRQGILVSLPALHRVTGMDHNVQLYIWILGSEVRL